ncbi:hypothetical protein [Photobacterium swingsii]|uniref:hypothetical protein n=1 Tax=Photobacterium swingsii TaxID=680026 RepID=UPI0040680BB0
MCFECGSRTEEVWFLQLSKKIYSVMSMSCEEDFYPFRGNSAYVTLNKKTQLLDVSYHTKQPHDSDLLSFFVSDIEHLKDIVFQIIKLGYRCLYWTNSEEVEEECPPPPPGLERLNYYLASMSYWDGKCCTYRYLRSEISSLMERGTISPDFSTMKLLAEIPIAND